MSIAVSARSRANDEGFTLIEIVVAMFILALVAVALLPLLINGTKQAAQSAAVASATQIVNAQLSYARAAGPTCSAILTAASPAVGNKSSYRGVPLQLAYSVGACPTTPAPTATTPGTIQVTATVTRTDTGKTLATATTLIYVTGS
jgi:prepilin-type N-terminal cleavage/methylation domain-containing protein